MDFLRDEFAEEFEKRREQIEAWYACDHAGKREPRRRVVKGGTVCVYDQCAHCGEGLGAVKKSLFTAAQVDAMPAFDEGLRDERWREKREKIDAWRESLLARQEAAKTARDSAWWVWYNQYLTTPEWKQRRAAVMRRADGICEGCGTGRASQVHHLTYKHVGNEFLFELVAVCDGCHRRLHNDQQAGVA
jgi:5-methylcytosine-specific restriction endonuclease McrA